MSSTHDTYKILIAGDQELGYSLCAKFIDKKLSDPRMVALESLAHDWPEDEWKKYVTVSVESAIVTFEFQMELHGPWVWELYSVMEPRDYFRRFDAAVIAADPRHSDSYTHLPSFIESIDIHIGHRIPMVIVADPSDGLSENEVQSVATLASQLDLSVVHVNILSGENIDIAFKSIAEAIVKEIS
ncbi:MAG: hypothetical protein ACTSUB_03040 [Candidatus Thorarchaeota archaeon]